MKTHCSLRAWVGFVLFAIVGLCFFSASEADARTWTRQNGDHFDADLVRLEGGNGGFVVLQKLSGTEVSIRLWNLSEEDQQYVKQCAPVAKATPKPEPRPAEAKAEANPEPPETAPQAAEQPARRGRGSRGWWPIELAGRVLMRRR